MIEGKTVLAIIPARGGSKGVPRKNIRHISGKPLIAWTIESALQSKFIDRTILSSEDEEIICVAKKWGCEVPFIRPVELAQDDTPGIDPILHAMEALDEKYDYVVLLQPTSPLRAAEDIDNCIQLCIDQNANACVTVTMPDKSPYWMYTLDESNRIHSVIKTDHFFNRRQELPKVYVLNGAVYIARHDWLLENQTFLTEETIASMMPKQRSLDIDTELDISILEKILSN